jgi:hypothetical protein
MTYFTHHFETVIARHKVGTYGYTVVYLDRAVHDALPAAFERTAIGMSAYTRRMGPGYRATVASAVSSVTPSTWACATSSRSNGSR